MLLICNYFKTKSSIKQNRFFIIFIHTINLKNKYHSVLQFVDAFINNENNVSTDHFIFLNNDL